MPMEWSLMGIESKLISLKQKDYTLRHQEFTWGDLHMAVHDVGIITTEGMTGVMMIEASIADHIEEVDGELLKTEIRYIEHGDLLLTTVMEVPDLVPDLNPILIAVKVMKMNTLKPALELG